MKFESSLRAVSPNWTAINATGKERQRPKYSRQGTKQTVTTRLDSLFFTQTVEDASSGMATVDVRFTAKADTALEGVFFAVALPVTDYADGSIELTTPSDPATKPVKISSQQEELRFTARGIRFNSSRRQLELLFNEPTLILIRKERIGNRIQVYLPIHRGAVQKNLTARKTFTIKASGELDQRPIQLTVNTTQPGRAFTGFGGNFRIQNPKTDPQVIDYSLTNMRVAWSRVEMPWRFWQPEKDGDPIREARAGNLKPQVRLAMEMAQRLSKQGIPIILSAWSGPAWSVVGEPKFRPGPDGVWGNPLEKANTTEIYKSITDYVLYLKEAYGVDVAMFSFNESDLGINVRQTGQEHADLIKGLGAYFASKGLKTKLLLGDNSDATTYEFVYPAMNDPQARPYIGAISFHSWRGWEKETLEKWASAAEKLQVPLIVGEGSIDAAAWNYPAVFEEPTYALEEINLYTRLLAICQPLTILQWQLTADYSPLVGGGIFGNNEPLRPTQRFWNLKQLASTPKDLLAMPMTIDQSHVSGAALGDVKRGVYAVHLVNTGTTRQVTLSGLPQTVKTLRIYTTDIKRAMQEGKRIPVAKGAARFTLDSSTYATLVSE